ncbi:hypothetical protein RHSIM_Rhsim05G0130700 [Rhododendron simsii]|uniref:Reverse transcriptase domain-containing protein n=1 Tax=Rhododendron simsii TaxID=118357 RepID=A0A834H0H8_RHOSS|nr:hypothetical protein RHSIM_Rhsim05G0130700 [Rhododendron simsii]
MRGYHKSSSSPRCAMKVDIMKAYDNVRWEFLWDVLSSMNFHPTMIKLLQARVTTANYSLSINGEVTGFILGKRGIRQGDPLSSYLFVIVMEWVLDFDLCCANVLEIEPRVLHWTIRQPYTEVLAGLVLLLHAVNTLELLKAKDVISCCLSAATKCRFVMLSIAVRLLFPQSIDVQMLLSLLCEVQPLNCYVAAVVCISKRAFSSSNSLLFRPSEVQFESFKMPCFISLVWSNLRLLGDLHLDGVEPLGTRSSRLISWMNQLDGEIERRQEAGCSVAATGFLPVWVLVLCGFFAVLGSGAELCAVLELRSVDHSCSFGRG